MALPIDLIRFLRGPYSAMPSAVGVLLEGEGCEAAIDDQNSGFIETLWLGGHDSQNKLIGPGFQVLTYAGPPKFSAPVGVAVLDPQTAKIWVSQGWQGDLYGLSQATNPTPFLGWFGFCACVVSGAEAASSGNSSAGGGGVSGGIVTNLCPDNPLPTTLFATLSGFTTCTCFNGSFALTHQVFDAGNGNYDVWGSGAITGCPGQSKTAYITFGYQPLNNNWYLSIGSAPTDADTFDCAAFLLGSVSCSPFVASGTTYDAGSISDFCSDPNEARNLRWTVTT